MLAAVNELYLDEHGTSALEVDGRNASWIRAGELFKSFELDEPISLAVLTKFNNEPVAVILCGDMVYCYSEDGKLWCSGLQFSPKIAVACANGVVFQFEQKLYIMTDPQKFVGIISPSSTSSIDVGDTIVYFGENDVALAVLRCKNKFKLFYTRKILPRVAQKQSRHVSSVSSHRRHSILKDPNHQRIISTSSMDDSAAILPSLSDLELAKEAIIIYLCQVEFDIGCNVEIIGQKFNNEQAIYLFDKSSQLLQVLVFSNNSKVPVKHITRRAQAVAKLSGFKVGEQVFPLVLLLVDSKLYLYSAFFDLAELAIDFGPVKSLVGTENNSFVVTTQENLTHHQLFLITDFEGGLVAKCFELLVAILEPEATMYWLLMYQGIHRLMPNESSWSVFFMTVVSCLCTINTVEQIKDQSWLQVVQYVQQDYPRLSFDHNAGAIILSLHMLREELLLVAHTEDMVDNMGLLLSFLTHHSGWEDWVGYYGVYEDLDWLLGAAEGYDISIAAHQAWMVVPNIYATLISLLAPPYIEYPNLSTLKKQFYNSTLCQRLFEAISEPNITVEDMVSLFKQLKLSPSIIQQLAEGIRIPIMEVISRIQKQATTGSGTPEQFRLLNRRDLDATVRGFSARGSLAPLASTDFEAVIGLIFQKDQRFREAVQLLSYTTVPECHLVQKSDLSDHEWLRLLSDVQAPLVIRTYCLAFGIAAMYFGTKYPFISERLHLPNMEFKMYMSESNVHVTYDSDQVPDYVQLSGYFHQGISIGLSVAADAPNVTGSWIVYNKPEPENVCLRHAGFLLGLGLVGHLKRLEEWHTYNYMGGKDPVISAALLIGLPASYLGTMDNKLTKVLSVHIPALLPLGSNDLNVRDDVQTAAVLGMGLLYLESKHRRMCEVFLSEITAPNRDKFYRSICGVAIGLINLGKGPEFLGVADSKIVDALDQQAIFMTEDINRRPSAEFSSNAAVLALQLMFVKSNNARIAGNFEPPKSKILASYGRPDLLFTRSMAHHLIMWDSIGSDYEWILSVVPESLRPESAGLSTLDLPWLNILGGVTAAFCLRHAGSQNLETLGAALKVMDLLMDWADAETDSTGCYLNQTSPEYLVALANINYVLASVVMAASTIVVSSGNLDLLRRLRVLHHRKLSYLVCPAVYNLQAAVSLSIGVLFMGGCQYSFDTTKRSIGFLSIAIGMLASTTKVGDIVFWQFLRYLWVFSIRKSGLVLKDVDTDEYVQAHVTLSGDSFDGLELQTPALLPSDTSTIELSDSRYLPQTIDLAEQSLVARELTKTRILYVQRVSNATAQLSLEQCLKHEQHVPSTTNKLLDIISKDPSRRASYMWGLRILFAFADFWNGNDMEYISISEIDKFKLNVWRAVNSLVDSKEKA